jgi:hypothetical protein
MPSTTFVQELNYKTAIILAEGVRQVAVKVAGGNQAAVAAADATYMRSLLTSADANGLVGPRVSLKHLTGSFT